MHFLAGTSVSQSVSGDFRILLGQYLNIMWGNGCTFYKGSTNRIMMNLLVGFRGKDVVI